MLGRQIDLHVGVAVIVGAPAGRLLGVDRLPLHGLPALNQLHKLRGLLRLVDPPAVAPAGDAHRLPVGGFKILRVVVGIILVRQLLHVLRHSGLVEDRLVVRHAQPVLDSGTGEDLRDIAEFVSHLCPHIPVQRVGHSHQRLTVLRERRLLVKPLLLEGNALSQTGHRRLHGLQRLVLLHAAAFRLGNDGVAAALLVCGDGGIHRRLGRGLVEAGKGIQLLLKLLLVEGHHGVQRVLHLAEQPRRPRVGVLLLDNPVQAPVKHRVQTDLASFQSLALPAAKPEGQAVIPGALVDQMLRLLHGHPRHRLAVQPGSREKCVLICNALIYVKAGAGRNHSTSAGRRDDGGPLCHSALRALLLFPASLPFFHSLCTSQVYSVSHFTIIISSHSFDKRRFTKAEILPSSG